jgi:tRNA-specific 2-thiouridylase
MKRVVVGMSGGVDSSVAAAVLLELGYEVIGATMLVWSPPGVEMNYSESCCGLSAAEDARRVCARLGIRHYTLDFQELFYERIIKNYVSEYQAGRTPNPCVLCNEWIKFRALLDHSRALGADAVATGHYARIRYDEDRRRWLLLRGTDRRKDQSYALYRLTQEQLAATLFPLGELDKTTVRDRARELGLPTAGKPDSQETCFVPNNDYPALLQILIPDSFRPGEIRTPEGHVLGRHAGTLNYTIGQRKRINVGSPVPLYVGAIDAERDTITVAPAGHPMLERTEVVAEQINGVSVSLEELSSAGSTAGTAKIRYNAVDNPAHFTVSQETSGWVLRAVFERPQRAVTPGQSLVCYQGEEIVCGGLIRG